MDYYGVDREYQGRGISLLLRLGAIAALIASLSAAAVADARADKRVALVIGNSAYRTVPDLPNSGNDAAAMADLFKQAGFNVVELRRNVGINDLRRTLREFSNAVRDADIAAVYYAGHGIEVDGSNYLIPVDARLEADIDVEDETVSLERVLKILEPAKRLRLIILDACRENPFAKLMKRTSGSRAVGRGLAQVEPASSDTLIAFAARAGSLAADGDGRSSNSPFTAALIKYIAAPGVDLRIAFGQVRDEVLKTTNYRQEPFVYGSLGGATLALVPAPQSKAQDISAAQATPLEEIRRDYEYAERVGTTEAWDSFLSLHGTGFYADLARAQRAKLGGPTSAGVPGAAVAILQPSGRSSDSAAKPAAPPIDLGIARQLQAHLKRVGCDPGAIDGSWTDNSSRALELFNKHAGTRLDVKLVSLDALDAVRSKSSRVCPLVCGKGFRAEDDKCIEAPTTAARPESNRAIPAQEPKPAEAAKPSSSGGIICTSRGCQPVPSNCRVERTRKSLQWEDTQVCQ